MNSYSNKKELDHGFLNIDEVTDYSGKVSDVVLWYYPNNDQTRLCDWQSQITFEIQSYDEYGKFQKVKIHEFSSKFKNCGYGTLVMQEFFIYLEKNQAHPMLVEGILSEIDGNDINNKQRRDHIYKKFGFDFIGKEIRKVID